jgi:hypothetical protein
MLSVTNYAFGLSVCMMKVIILSTMVPCLYAECQCVEFHYSDFFISSSLDSLC